jgi:hypothetical protein
MLVSAILLSHPRPNEKEFVSDAVFCFNRQSYLHLELIEVHDGFNTGVVQTPMGMRITTEPGKSVGAKRNLACEQASGELIVHWDSDDLSHQDRILTQVQQIRSSSAELTGYHTIHFLNDEQEQAHFYHSYPGYALGTSLMYYRSIWSRTHFEDVMVGEDNIFLRSIRYEKKYTVDADRMLIARNHSFNTSYREMREESGWTVEDYGIIREWADELAPGRYHPHAIRERHADRLGDRPGPGRGPNSPPRRRGPSSAVFSNSNS